MLQSVVGNVRDRGSTTGPLRRTAHSGCQGERLSPTPDVGMTARRYDDSPGPCRTAEQSDGQCRTTRGLVIGAVERF